MITCTISVSTKIHFLRKRVHVEAIVVAKVIHSIAYFGITGVNFTSEKAWQVWRLVIDLKHVKAQRCKRISIVREQEDVL